MRSSIRVLAVSDTRRFWMKYWKPGERSVWKAWSPSWRLVGGFISGRSDNCGEERSPLVRSQNCNWNAQFSPFTLGQILTWLLLYSTIGEVSQMCENNLFLCIFSGKWKCQLGNLQTNIDGTLRTVAQVTRSGGQRNISLHFGKSPTQSDIFWGTGENSLRWNNEHKGTVVLFEHCCWIKFCFPVDFRLPPSDST